MSEATAGLLAGKFALVTGGSRGLGREMVVALAREGADVIISSRKREACEAVARELHSLGRKATAIAAHAGEWRQMETLAETGWGT